MDCNEIISQISERQQRIKADMMLYSGSTKNISNQTPLDRDFKDSYKTAKNAIYKERNSREFCADILVSAQNFPQKVFDNAIFEKVTIKVSSCEYRNNALVFDIEYENPDNAILFTKSGIVFKCDITANNDGIVRTSQKRFNVVSNDEHHIKISVSADIQDIVLPANLIKLSATTGLYYKPSFNKDDIVMLSNSQAMFTVFIGDSVTGDSDEFKVSKINDRNVVVTYRENKEKVIVPNTVDESKLTTEGSEYYE